MEPKKRGSKLGGAIGWILFAVFVGWIWNKWQGDKTPPVPAAETADVAAELPEAAPGGYSEHGGRDNWPPLPEGTIAVATLNESARSNYYLVLDGSGSMKRHKCSGDLSKIDAAVRALSRFVAALPADANLGLAVFDGDGMSERVPLAAGTQPAVLRALGEVRASGATPLRSSIQLGYERLTEQAQRQLGYGEYHLVVVTDGMPDPDSEDPSEVVETLLHDSPVVLHTIGFCIGTDHPLNQPGRVYYFAADTPEKLDEGLGNVLAEAPAFDVGSFGP